MFEVFVIVQTVVARLPFGAHKIVALFPDAEGMRFNTGKVFDITYRENVHSQMYKSWSFL